MTAWIVAAVVAVVATNGLTIWWVSALERDLLAALEDLAETKARAEKTERSRREDRRVFDAWAERAEMAAKALREDVARLQRQASSGLAATQPAAGAPAPGGRVVEVRLGRRVGPGEYAIHGSRAVPVVSDPVSERGRTKTYRSPGVAATGEAMRAVEGGAE